MRISSNVQSEFDVIHNQADFPAHSFANLVATPIVTTIHGFSSERIMPMYKPFERRVHFVAISEVDRHPDLHYAATIHHGIRLEDFPFAPFGADNLLFFGPDTSGTRVRQRQSRSQGAPRATSIFTALCRTQPISNGT